MSDILEQLRTELNFMQKWIDDLKITIAKLEFEEEDIRKDYFYTSHTNVNHYYLAYMNIVNSFMIKNKHYVIDKSLERKFGSHLDRLSNLSRDQTHCDAHFNTINQRVFVMAWSLFELSISTFYKAIVDDKELERQNNELYKNVLKNATIKEGAEEKLKKLLLKTSLHEIPIGRKYNYLFKIVRGYSRNIKKDKEFLIFFGKMRNTIHSNFIYYGSDFTYRFGDAEFLFKNEKQVTWSDPFRDGKLIPSVELYFHLIGQLNEIVHALFKYIKFDSKIPYPDLNAH